MAGTRKRKPPFLPEPTSDIDVSNNDEILKRRIAEYRMSVGLPPTDEYWTGDEEAEELFIPREGGPSGKAENPSIVNRRN